MSQYSIEELKKLVAQYAETCNEYPDESYISERDEVLYVTETFFEWLTKRELGD